MELEGLRSIIKSMQEKAIRHQKEHVVLVKKLTERHEADRMGLVRAQQKLEAKGLQREKDNQKLKILVDNNKKNYILKEEELRI